MYDCYTGKPLKNFPLRIIEQSPNPFQVLDNSKATVLTKFSADSNGHYTITCNLKKKNKNNYLIELNCDSGFQALEHHIKLKTGLVPKHYATITKTTLNQIDFYVAYTAALTLVINNPDNKSIDSMVVELTADIMQAIHIYECKGIISNNWTTRYIPAGHPITIKWTSWKKGQYQLRTDTINLKPNERYFYKINL